MTRINPYEQPIAPMRPAVTGARGTTGVSGATPATPASRGNAAKPASELEISPEVKAISVAMKAADIVPVERRARIEQLRADIMAGTFVVDPEAIARKLLGIPDAA